MIREHDATSTGRSYGIYAVFDTKAGLRAGVTEDFGVFVGTDAADEDGAGRGKDVLLERCGSSELVIN